MQKKPAGEEALCLLLAGGRLLTALRRSEGQELSVRKPRKPESRRKRVVNGMVLTTIRKDQTAGAAKGSSSRKSRSVALDHGPSR